MIKQWIRSMLLIILFVGCYIAGFAQMNREQCTFSDDQKEKIDKVLELIPNQDFVILLSDFNNELVIATREKVFFYCKERVKKRKNKYEMTELFLLKNYKDLEAELSSQAISTTGKRVEYLLFFSGSCVSFDNSHGASSITDFNAQLGNLVSLLR